jgi:uncharacterized protein with von Willebrand factor type A (vWA) domain
MNEDSQTSQDIQKHKERVALLIDTSGSMDSAWPGYVKLKLHAAADALQAIVEASDAELTDYSLTGFDSATYQVCPFGASLLAVSAGAYRLQARATTNMADGLLTVLHTNPSRIILLTDGQADNPARVMQEVDRAVMLQVKIDCVGIGDANDEFLRTICEKTGGIYHRAQSPDELSYVFQALETQNRLMLEHQS